MQEVIDLVGKRQRQSEQQAELKEDIANLSDKIVMVMTPVGVKSLSFHELEIESSLENALRLHMIHSIRRR